MGRYQRSKQSTSNLGATYQHMLGVRKCACYIHGVQIPFGQLMFSGAFFAPGVPGAFSG